MTDLTDHTHDRLDDLANRFFPGRVVRKDLVRQVKVGASVPVYVLEFLLGRYCASADPLEIEAGLVVVNQMLADNFIRPDESEKAKADLKKKGKHRLIDKVDIRFVEGDKKFWATLHNFGSKHVNVPEEIVFKYDRLLGGGAWCQLDLVYNDLEDPAQRTPFYISGLKPIQVAAFEMDSYLDARREFSRDDWLDLVMRTLGLEPSEYDLRGKLLALTRLIPMAERNYNLIELGPWGTGKSFVYRESNPNTILISGGKVTVPQLFINMSSGRVGLLGTWDAVAFDEVAGLQMSDSTVVNMLKDFMESGSFARGREEVPAEASVVFVGNTSKPHEELVRTAHLFADLPPSMIDPAFLDRLHYYLPGWEAPKLEKRLFTDHFGFVSDYFAEALRQMRKQTFVRAIDQDFTLGSHLAARDEKAVRKTVSGLLKILHPHGEWSQGELREYLEFAIEGRRRVKEQLKKLAAYDYAKTSFSYIENDTAHEVWVDVPEQMEELDVEAAGSDAVESAQSRRLAESGSDTVPRSKTVTVGHEDVTTSAESYKVGDVIDDRYKVLGILGQGGFSKVYKVLDAVEGTEYAFKMFTIEEAEDAVRQEITALRKVQHPNVVKVIWADQTNAGNWFLVMEYVRGKPLTDFVGGGEQLPIDEVLQIGDQLLSALAEFHPDPGLYTTSTVAPVKKAGEGLVHRDIKPENIILTETGVKLLDFNISSVAGAEVETLKHTPGYLAPDVEYYSRWDASPDLFATGVVLYELLCQKHPYEWSDPIRGNGPIDPADFGVALPPKLREFLMKACARSRSDRYFAAFEMRNALRDSSTSG